MNHVKTSTGILLQGEFSQGSDCFSEELSIKNFEVSSQGHVEAFIIHQLYEQLYTLSCQDAQVAS